MKQVNYLMTISISTLICLAFLAVPCQSFSQETYPDNIHVTYSEKTDKTAGEGGTRSETTVTTDLKDGSKKIQKIVVYRDAKGRTHDSTSTITNDQSDKFIDQVHYTYSKANNGTETKTITIVKRDDAGYEDRTVEKFTKKADDKDFKQTSGTKTKDGKITETYNPETGNYENVGKSTFPSEHIGTGYNRNEIGIVVKNLFRFGDCCSSCDKMPSVNYTYYFRQNLGIIVDASYSWGKEIMQTRTRKFSKFDIEAGAVYVPFRFANLKDKFTVSTFGTAGILLDHKTLSRIVTTRSTSPTGGTITATSVVTNNYEHNAFVADLGGAVDWNLSPLIHIRVLEIDHNFFETKHANWNFGTGIDFRFH